MRKAMVAISMTLCIFSATYGLLWGYIGLQKKQAPTAVDGVLDLSSWAFKEKGAVPLDGEWEFYPNRLLSGEEAPPSSTSVEAAAPETIRVPGSWSTNMKPIGMATYRLRIHMGNTSGLFGIKMASVQISNRLIVNGEVAGSSGKPGERLDYYAVNKPYVSYFMLLPGWNEIGVQVANYEYSGSSGIIESIHLGTADQISNLRGRALTHDWVTVTAFLIIGLYFIGLYSQRKHDRSLLVFAMFCVSIVLYTSTRGERVLLEVFGEMPFWLYFRLQMLAAISSGVGFCLYVYSAFRPFCSGFIVRSNLVLGGSLLLLYVAFATGVGTEMSNMMRLLAAIYITISLLYATYIFMLAALHKVEGGRYLLFAAIALDVQALKQNMNVYFGVEIYRIVPFEPFLVLLMLALFMSQRFSNAYRKIEDLSEQLLGADKMKDDFLARTSHEFKSPLHGVLNISRSMLEDAADPPMAERRQKLELIIDITSRLSQLVYDILDFSKLKQGELRIVPASTDVRSTVEHQVRIYTYLCSERNIRLVNDVPSDLPAAYVDESRLSQILGNLLDNAAKHTEDGSIVVTAAEQEDGMISVSVMDTGEGIEAHDLPHIFEPFVTSDGTKSRGFGLGLSIAKQLVELQNGQFTVVSTLGVGTTLTFTLPIANQGTEAKIFRASGPIIPKLSEFTFITPYDSKREGKHTVLIVDDEFVNLKVLLDALHRLDYRAIAVKNGYEALEQLNGTIKVDLVILDLMMPGLSGYEVCQAIRKRFSLLELPVLMVTAAIQPHDKVAAFQAGANDYLLKPFDPEELKARIGSLLTMKESVSKAIRLEVAFLQSQIKPHFLFNVLNSIAAAGYTDAEQAQEMIVNLADYLRGSFRFSNTVERVSFAEEFELIQTYVDIEQARFKDRIRFETDIADSAFDLYMPPLLLQPLVENAIRHGIGDRLEGGTVQLLVSQTDSNWTFVVSDDGVGIERGRLSQLLDYSAAIVTNGVGLLNISQRLRLEYGVLLEVESMPGRGTKVTFAIPSSLM